MFIVASQDSSRNKFYQPVCVCRSERFAATSILRREFGVGGSVNEARRAKLGKAARPICPFPERMSMAGKGRLQFGCSASGANVRLVRVVWAANRGAKAR